MKGFSGILLEWGEGVGRAWSTVPLLMKATARQARRSISDCVQSFLTAGQVSLAPVCSPRTIFGLGVGGWEVVVVERGVLGMCWGVVG